MIFKGSHSPAGQFDAVAAAVLRPIERLLPADAASKQEHLQAVARGVADYVCSESTTAAAGPDLTVLMMRALSATGERELARRLFVLSQGLTRRSDWAVAGGAGIWILDLARLDIGDGDALELTLFASLRHVLMTVADDMEISRGRGALGLQNLVHVAAAVVGGHDAHAFRFADEIRNYCRDWFARAARTWDHVPHVIRLD